MPTQTNDLSSIDDRIMELLRDNMDLAYSSKEIAQKLNIAHSTARKHCKALFDERTYVNRGKRREFNKTYFYYVEVQRNT